MTSLFFPNSFLFFSTRRILCLFVVFCLLKNNLGEKSREKKFKKKKTPTFFSALLDKKERGVKIIHVSITHTIRNVDVVVELCQTLGNDRKDLPRSGGKERFDDKKRAEPAMRDSRVRRRKTNDTRSRAIPNEKRTKTRKVGDSVSKRDDGGKQEDDLSRGRARAGDADHLAALLLREISRARGEGAGRRELVLVETIDAAN